MGATFRLLNQSDPVWSRQQKRLGEGSRGRIQNAAPARGLGVWDPGLSCGANSFKFYPTCSVQLQMHDFADKILEQLMFGVRGGGSPGFSLGVGGGRSAARGTRT